MCNESGITFIGPNVDAMEALGNKLNARVKMNEAGDKFSVQKNMRFTCLDEFIAQKIDCDFVIDATMDEMHYDTAVKIIDAGYNLILEKPITGQLEELKDIEKRAKAKDVKVLICHVLRYTLYYRTIKEIIDSGKIGKVVSMQLFEHVWYGHNVNAYVRGKWRSEKLCGSGMLLAKCCHDTDLMCWFNNVSQPTKVSSFGSRSFYVPENAPKGATKYCHECPHKDTCMFNAHKFEILNGRDNFFGNYVGVYYPTMIKNEYTHI